MMIKRDMALDNLIKVCQETLQIIGDMVENDSVAYSRGYEDGMAAEAQVQKTLKPWVGLTDKEYIHITDTVFHQNHGLVAYYLAIEAKLKEKNNV
jgi:hypothetical protein